MAEKSEKATPKKLRDARKKGQIAKSQDFPASFTFIVSIAATLITAGYIFDQLASYLISSFKSIRFSENLQEKSTQVMVEAIHVIFKTSIPIALLTTCVGVLTAFLVAGPLFSMEAMKPDLKKLNPIDNLKNLFKFKTLFELLKSVLKITGALILIYSVVWDSLPEIINTASISVYGSALIFRDFLIKVIIRVGIFFLIVAVADLIYQKKNFAKEMKMEKFEVKQEYKDTEGDPHIKSKRKQAAQELAYQEGPASIKRAKALITNPTHLAIALSYDPVSKSTPKILFMGKGFIAEQMMKLAVDYNVPVMRNVALAQTLFEKGQMHQFIPQETYEAVAEILQWIEGLESHELTDLELFK